MMMKNAHNPQLPSEKQQKGFDRKVLAKKAYKRALKNESQLNSEILKVNFIPEKRILKYLRSIIKGE